jgi:shikimate kinase
MSDYYEPYPRLRLSRAVVLAGQIGCGAAAIGRNVASRTGLPFSEVDRLIEHEAGSSLARLVVEEGPEGLAGRAEAVLARLAGRSPRGLIVVDRAWLPLTARDLLRRRTHFVFIRRPADYLFERLDQELRRSGDWILGGLEVPIRDAVDLKPLLDRRDPLLRESRIVLDGGSGHVHRVAEVLLDSLERICGADSL